MSTPLILVDVDGVLNPDQQSSGYRKHTINVDGLGYRVLLNPAHARMLTDLAEETRGELVWATFWGHHANREIAPRLRLPQLPVIETPTRRRLELLNPKTPAVATYVDGRPFVWFDDDLGVHDEDYLKSTPGVGSYQLIQVDSRTGLTKEHVQDALVWLLEVTS